MGEPKLGNLVVTRNIGEAIYIGKDVVIIVNKINSMKQVSIAVRAPKEVRISRSEGKVADEDKKL